ncbi:MAG TPA: hypothetical protein VF669_00265 [Tepidisphaeraceae bacterium]|jgi:energy-converting hydrogenase Eha subunit E
MSQLERIIAFIQSAYFVLTGVWPLLHMPSFLAVTGPKHDLWLVKTVGVLITVIGVAIGIGAYETNFPLAMKFLAVGSAVALAGVDINYVLRKVIPPIYLLDAAAEAVLIAAWILAWVVR